MNLVCCAPGTEWVDPEDPTVIAENELLGAAAAIEAAAKKLEQLRPRTKPKVREASLTAPQVFTLSLLTLRRGHMLRLFFASAPHQSCSQHNLRPS